MKRIGTMAAAFAWFGGILLQAAEPSDPLTPKEEMASFVLADDNLAVDLIAAEPDVFSPVAIAWDADGRLFVAEMIDYPTGGPAPGRIRMLLDRDKDGRYGKSVIFADNLAFVNGLLPWKGGVLATAAPDLWYLRDSRGEGHADERRVLFTGFGKGNHQLRANGLVWGLDNWIYGANGRSDGEIRRPDDPAAPAVSIRKRDFRFRPETGEFQAIAGQSQFGSARDDWGNRFLSWNTIPIRHEVIPERYLSRNPHMGSTESVLDILTPGDSGRVFPLSPQPLVFNDEPPGYFNALAGLTIYRGDALGPTYQGNAFIGESLRNLVHRRVLMPRGPTFVADRGEQGKEFLASTDPWFHPVNFATGPDGALYIVDFYRRFVEHPHWVSEASRGKVEWRAGAEHGRIWRVQARKQLTSGNISGAQPPLSSAGVTELVHHLEDSNAWWRDTCQRLLVERQDQMAGPLLRKVVLNSELAVARLQALWTLEGLSALDVPTLSHALHDTLPAVRAHALRLVEGRLNTIPELAGEALKLTSDPDARVRLQLALSLGEWKSNARTGALHRLAASAAGDRWQSLAVLTSIGERPWLFLHRADRSWIDPPTEEQARFLNRVAVLVGASTDERDLVECLEWLEEPLADRSEQMALLAGLAEGLGQSNHPFPQLLRQPAVPLVKAVKALQPLIHCAVDVAGNADAKLRLRLAAIHLLGKTEPAIGGKALLQLLQPRHPAEIQAAAASAVVELADTHLAVAIFADWRQYAKATRARLLAAGARAPIVAVVVLDALESGRISPLEMDASARQSLKRLQNVDIQKRVQTLLQGATSPDRQVVVFEYQPALQMSGDGGRGAAIFARTCLVCHAVQGRGNRVGPDLSSIASHSKETLLVDILDPSRQVPPDYLSYIVKTVDGELFTGVLVAESAGGVTLRRPNEADLTIPRTRIRDLRAEGKSVMPDGLEQGLQKQDMADLLEFLRHPRSELLPEFR